MYDHHGPDALGAHEIITNIREVALIDLCAEMLEVAQMNLTHGTGDALAELAGEVLNVVRMPMPGGV